jgi:hypothetical protein
MTEKSIPFASLRGLLEEKPDLAGVGRPEPLAALVQLMFSKAVARAPEYETALDRLLPGGAKALKELEDVSWVRELNEGRSVLTETHVRLAWAVFFLRFATCQRLDIPLPLRINEFRTVQAPGLDDDLRSNALGTALELLILGVVDRHEFATAALLGAWVLSDNYHLEGPTFLEVLEHEPVAYCKTIEALLVLTGELPWEEYFTRPLADSWRRGELIAETIQPCLTRWLLLVWDEASQMGEESVEVVHEGIMLPRASSWRALQLERLAIGVLANRPDPELLRTLCRQAGSWDLSRDKDGMWLKDYFQWAGALMRWGFGEEALQELEQIAAMAGSAPFEVIGAKRLARTLWQFRLPASLREKPRRRDRPEHSRFEEEIESLRVGKPGLLLGARPEQFWVRYWPKEIASLAADPSVPNLQAPDLAALKASLEMLVRNHDLWAGPAAGSSDLALEAWLPWLSRLDPEAWSNLLTELVEKALDYPNPHYLLGQLPALMPWPSESSVSKQLPRTLNDVVAKARGTNVRDSKLLLWNLMRIAVHLEDKDKLRECLFILGKTDDPAEVTSLYPLPWLLPQTVDRAIFEEAGQQLAKRLPKPARRYWLSIQAALAWLWPPERRLAWYFGVSKFASDLEATGRLLLAFLLNIDHPSVLRIALENPYFKELLEDPYFRYEAAEWARIRTEIELPYSYEYLLENFLIESLGPWLLAARRTADFLRWGRDIFAAMTSQAEQAGAQDQKESWIEWVEGPIKRRARMVKDGRGILESDHALLEWARQEPNEFLERLAGFQKQIRSPFHLYWNLTGFARAAALAWMEIEPVQAYEWLKTFEEETRETASTNGVPSAIYHLWNLKFSKSLVHRDLRRSLLATAKTDAEIAGHVFAARMQGTLAEMDRLVKPLLKSSSQLDRVLAVSILAWHPKSESTLDRLKRRDPSLWVRDHAAWASKICQWDRLGRRVYTEALGASTVLQQQAKLQQLAPVLMPTFPVWPFEDRSISGAENQLDPQRRALLVEFKERAKPLGLSRSKLFGRELSKHCRGERLDRFSFGLGRQLLPWW